MHHVASDTRWDPHNRTAGFWRLVQKTKPEALPRLFADTFWRFKVLDGAR